MDLIILITLLVLTYITGGLFEKNHYKNIKKREIALYKSPCITYGKAYSKTSFIRNAELVAGSVVLACDYFKVFIASLKNLFGGNVSAFESVLDRGRREALLRMREEAKAKGATAVINVKIETIMLEPLGSKKAPKVCVTAYGTAIKYDK